MEMVFIKLLNMSISASWLILAVVLLRMILKGAPKWIRCILWGLVALRLIFPVSVKSIFSLLPTAETIPQDILYAENPVIHTGVTAINSVVNSYLSDSMTPDAGVSVNPMQIVMNLGAAIWVVGMIGMMIYAGISYLKIRIRVSASLPVRENIYFCDYIETPFVLGIVRPRIYLPSVFAEDEKAFLVVAHEKAHIRRHDHWWKPLGFLLLTVYWFNPVIWVAYILLCRDIELACDEYVVSHLEEEEKCAYSDALLACSIGRNHAGLHHNIISACPLAFGEVGVKDRVKAVLHYKKPAFWLVLLGVLGCIIVGICFLTNPKDNTLHASEPFGHSYRVEDVVYGDLRYSFAYTPENAPRYQLTSDYGMLVSGDVLDNAEGEEWSRLQGKFEEVKLSPLIFDEYFKNGTDGPTSMIGPDTIRVNTEKAWRINVQDDENGVFYYFVLTKQGDVYLTYGYDQGDSYAASEEGTLIRWVFKLARTDMLSCNAISEDSDAYVEAAYYPNGFDWDYEQLPQGYINEKGVLIFATDWDTDTLVVSEDYYNNFNSGNRSDSTHIEKETYTLERNKDGQFELNVELRSANGDMAVYFVQVPEGVYVMKIIFADDEAALDIAEKWDCSVNCAEESEENSYVITYSDEEILSHTGCITFQNRNLFAITVHLIGKGKEAFVSEIAPGGNVVFMQADKEVTYTVGIHADVEEGTELNLMVYDGEWSEVYTPVVDSEYVLDKAIKEAILNQYKPEKPDGLYHCVDFILLEQEEICGVASVNSGRDNMELITVYGMALHESLGFSGATFHEVAYDYVPVKLQFRKESEHEYVLKEAWFPDKTYESWDFYQEEIWKAFSTYSEDLATSAIYAIQDYIYLTSLRQKCYEQAVSYGEVDTDTVVEGLLEEVVASPGTFASGVKDYIVANDATYKELIHYGKYTLWYCFGEFLEGGQTDLRGQIMASVCRDISLGWGEALLIDSKNPAATGQDWFDIFRSNAKELQKQYSEEELNELYHASWLLLQVMQLQALNE